MVAGLTGTDAGRIHVRPAGRAGRFVDRGILTRAGRIEQEMRSRMRSAAIGAVVTVGAVILFVWPAPSVDPMTAVDSIGSTLGAWTVAVVAVLAFPRDRRLRRSAGRGGGWGDGTGAAWSSATALA